VRFGWNCVANVPNAVDTSMTDICGVALLTRYRMLRLLKPLVFAEVAAY
jgi:hypothetical protein